MIYIYDIYISYIYHIYIIDIYLYMFFINDLFNVLLIMYNNINNINNNINIMFVDLENYIVFKLKKIDNDYKNQMYYYSDKQNKAENVLNMIQITKESYNKILKNNNYKIINKMKKSHINLLKKELIIKNYIKNLQKTKEILRYILIQKKKLKYNL